VPFLAGRRVSGVMPSWVRSGMGHEEEGVARLLA
jgi:hypothetical protein